MLFLNILRRQFEYHTFLHHSQTDSFKLLPMALFEYHTFLHHSQKNFIMFENDVKMYGTQTQP